jgi:hypothetical protein
MAVILLDQEQVSEETNGPRLINEFNIEITFTRHLSPSNPEKTIESQYIHVTNNALQPKSFNIRIEEGNFLLPEDLSWTGPSAETPYTKRLVFDKSPYPPESEWKESWTKCWKEPEGKNYWD